MVEVIKSETFDRWLRKLKDRRAASDIEDAHRIARQWKEAAADEQDD